MRFLIKLVLILVLTSVKAQLIGDIIDPGYNNRNLWKENDETIKGSPFMFDEWSDGEIITKLGSTYTSVKIKYSAYSDQLFFLSENNIQQVLAKEKIDRFRFNTPDGQSLTFCHLPAYGYLLVLYEGDKLSLYKKIEKEIKEGSVSNGYNVASSKDEFISKEKYLIKVSDSFELIPVETKKDFLKLFETKSDSIKEIIKSEKIKFKSDDDLKELIIRTEQII